MDVQEKKAPVVAQNTFFGGAKMKIGVQKDLTLLLRGVRDAGHPVVTPQSQASVYFWEGGGEVEKWTS